MALLGTLAGLLAASHAGAATVYVKEEFKIGLHSAAERRAPILELVRAGAALEELSRDGNYVRVRTDNGVEGWVDACLLYTSPSPRDKRQSRMPSSA